MAEAVTLLVLRHLCRSLLKSNMNVAAQRVIKSPYAERPEGSRKSSPFVVQTFGTVRNISY